MSAGITQSSTSTTPTRINLDGVAFDAMTAEQVVQHIGRGIAAGRGGRVVTPNVDIVRRIRRCEAERGLVAPAELVVADGAPLVWASKLAGSALPERVAGSDLIWRLSEAAAEAGHRVFLLGGTPDGARSTAGLAADRLCASFHKLHVAGACSPPMGFDADEAAMTTLIEELVAAEAELVFVGLGFPKQERLIARLAPHLPGAWFLGCGAAIDFVAGTRRRAPRWMQRNGVEWLHRLASEPRRLFARYLIHDAPAACGLLARAGLRRFG